jgi:putative Mg2+ transporter-C (MgtC) family protein
MGGRLCILRQERRAAMIGYCPGRIAYMDVDVQTMALRMIMATVAGLIIGLERERHSRAAGLRTCMLVATAGALLMCLSIHLSQIFAGPADGAIIRLDPGRLPSYAIAGMGFLGAGAIIQGHSSARGVTTAASLWVCTGVGLALGAGLYIPAALAVVLTLATLWFLRIPAKMLRHEQYVRLEVEGASHLVSQPVRDLLEEYGATIHFVGRDQCLQTDHVNLSFSMVIHSGSSWAEMLGRLENIPGVACFTWQEDRVP